MKKAFTVFTLLTSCATAQMVEGNIINSVTSAGIPQAAVHLESASDSEDEPYDTVTDALGHFAFAQIKPGTYQFSWFSPSYIATEAPTFPQIHVTAGGGPLKLEGRMTVTCPVFLYQSQFGNPGFILPLLSYPAGAARREITSLHDGAECARARRFMARRQRTLAREHRRATHRS
jgi:hypothetical protein